MHRGQVPSKRSAAEAGLAATPAPSNGPDAEASESLAKMADAAPAEIGRTVESDSAKEMTEEEKQAVEEEMEGMQFEDQVVDKSEEELSKLDPEIKSKGDPLHMTVAMMKEERALRGDTSQLAELQEAPPAAPAEMPEGASGNERSMIELSEYVLGELKKWNPVVVEGMDPTLHYLPPHVPKKVWTALGDLVAARERSSSGSVPGDRWISLRLDGCNFSKTVKALRRRGILGPGFSDRFAQAMVTSLRGLMGKFSGSLGYTQSDEMIVFIPPTNVVRGVQQSHTRNGRVAKISTLAAGYVTAMFLTQLGLCCAEEDGGVEALKGLSELLPHFDCRVGQYSSWEEAQALLLWRAYDCSVNGVSDAVHQIEGSGKEIRSQGKREKIKWLWNQGKLPLPVHQAYGTVLVRVRRAIAGHNPKLNTTTTTLRSVIEKREGPVLELARTDTLFPEPDTC